MKKKLSLLLGVIVLGTLAALLLTQRPAAPRTVFTTLAGKPLPLQSLRGRVVLVNFWATSCPGCVKEMPELVKIYHRFHRRGYDTVAVAMHYDNPAYIRAFSAKFHIPFTIAFDTGGANAKAFGGVQLVPTSFLIDKNGRIVKSFLGEVDPATLRVLIGKELGVS
ncbi:MAG TPA: thioredoxin [Betaproteobacteria bacterium]|nr:thioredoxin [Betaproteobacteria bacterium]